MTVDRIDLFSKIKVLIIEDHPVVHAEILNKKLTNLPVQTAA